MSAFWSEDDCDRIDNEIDRQKDDAIQGEHGFPTRADRFIEHYTRAAFGLPVGPTRCTFCNEPAVVQMPDKTVVCESCYDERER